MRDLIVVRPARHAPLCAGRVRRVSGRLSFLRGVQRVTSPSAYVYNSPHGHTGTRADTGWWGFHVVRFGQVRATLNLGRFGQVPGEPGPNLSEPDLLEILNSGQVQVMVVSTHQTVSLLAEPARTRPDSDLDLALRHAVGWRRVDRERARAREQVQPSSCSHSRGGTDGAFQ